MDSGPLPRAGIACKAAVGRRVQESPWEGIPVRPGRHGRPRIPEETPRRSHDPAALPLAGQRVPGPGDLASLGFDAEWGRSTPTKTGRRGSRPGGAVRGRR
ncbi:hypothetical protein GCM10027079_27000 [Sediminivirga luteola]|uniref:Uncharacterized protein n=1 Tax=Sediminivirga luteola TaxID=1774748 RepID=A0A8J2U0B6_9MICO|nr:hypothetical protein GCM10011333_29300 [Sediminivirga luteola]